MATMVKTCRRGNPGMEMISLASSSEMAELGLGSYRNGDEWS